MPNQEISISHPDQFLKNIHASKNGIVLDEDGAIRRRNPINGDNEKIASYESGKLTLESTVDEKDETIEQLRDMDRAPDRLDLGKDDKASFERIFDHQDAKYEKRGGKIFQKGSDQEICEYSDGKFTLTRPDDASMQALVDMLHEGGVKRVTVLPENTPDGKRLQEMFLKKGIQVDNLSPPAKDIKAPGLQRTPTQSSRSTRGAETDTLSDQRLGDSGTPSKTFEETLEEIERNEGAYHSKKGRDFNSKFRSYDSPPPGTPLKMYRTERVGRSVTGKEANGIASAMINDYFRRRRIARGAAFEVDQETMAIRPLSEKRSAVKGMVRFAAAARTDPKQKLKFVASSEKAAKRFAQEAMKQGIPLDQVEIDIKDANGRIVQKDFKLSLLNEILTRDYMRMRTSTTGDRGSRSYLNDGKYGKQLNDLKIKPLFEKQDPDLVKAGQIEKDGKRISRFDPSRTFNNTNSIMNAPGSGAITGQAVKSPIQPSPVAPLSRVPSSPILKR